MSQGLPKGLWYEEKKSRYRVRLYRNGKVHRNGYHKELDPALEALDQLNKKLSEIPRLKRGEKAKGVIPVATFMGLASARH